MLSLPTTIHLCGCCTVLSYMMRKPPEQYLRLMELTDKDDLVFKHERNIQSLVVELFKIKNGGSLDLGSEIFVGEIESHNLSSYIIGLCSVP